MRRCGASVTGLAAGLLATAQIREIKAHNSKTVRYKRLVKDRIHYSRSWTVGFSEHNWEKHTVDAHEKESFENFKVYKYDSRKQPALTLWTTEIKKLPPIERYNALIPAVAERWKVVAAGAEYEKMKMGLEVLECFEDLARTLNITAAELTGEHADLYSSFVESTMSFAAKAHAQGHENSVLGMMRVAQVADALRDTPTRVRALQQARHFADTMDSVGPFKAAEPLPPVKPDKIRQLHAIDNTGVSMLPSQKPRPYPHPEALEHQRRHRDMLRPSYE